MAYSNSSNPVRIKIRTPGFSSFKLRASSNPFIYGILISVMTTSGCSFSAISIAFTPFCAFPITSNPNSSQLILCSIAFLTSSSSSTRSTLYVVIYIPPCLLRNLSAFTKNGTNFFINRFVPSSLYSFFTNFPLVILFFYTFFVHYFFFTYLRQSSVTATRMIIPSKIN